MDKNTFWEIIEDARNKSEGNLEIERQFIINNLSRKSEEEIKGFYTVYKYLLNDAYHAVLWNACVLINCGCDEEGFTDFRAWLIAQGREVFYKAIDDPETLVPLVSKEERGYIAFEEFAYIASAAFEKKTGHDLDDVELPGPVSLVGEQIKQEQISEKFPKLTAKLGDCWG